MTTIRYVTRDELLHRLEKELEEERITIEEFRAEGEADTLTDGNLRDLWLMYRPLLFDELPRQRPSRADHSGGRARPNTREGARTPSPSGGSPQEIDRTTTIRYVTRDELLHRLEKELEEERMTVGEFRAEGEADTLTDGNLRDMWLWYRPLLFD